MTLFTALLSVIVLAGCSKSMDHSSAYFKSYSAFQDFKKNSDNSYQYQVIQSSWVGSSTQTIITVRSGRVTNRDCIIKRYDGSTPANTLITEEWQEDATNLNTHTAGYPSRTLDEIYQLAKNEWLIKRDGVTNFFEAKNDGMISSCGYYDNNCADDCTIGVYISWIKKL